MVDINGAGFDWSYMADDKVPTNMALMAFLDFEVHNDKTCSKTCLKSFETLKNQLDDLRIEFNKSMFILATYKRGLASVEVQLVFYKKNEVIFCEQLAVLKRDISYKDSKISMLKSELEKLKQEKESIQLKIEKIDNASKRLFSPPKLDLSNFGLEEFQQPKFEGYRHKTRKSVNEDICNEVRESPYAPLVEELVSNDKLEKKNVFPTVAKIEFVRPKQQEKPVRKPVKYAEMYMSRGPRGNQRKWNNQKSQQLGSDFVMYNKACFVCGSFDHVQANYNYHEKEKVVSGNNYTRVIHKKKIKAMLTVDAQGTWGERGGGGTCPVYQDLWNLIEDMLPLREEAKGGGKLLGNKKDERGIVIKNKARLVAQGYTQEEGIDYDKVFAPVARIEAIRLFLAYASFKDFVVYQIDVKSAFLYDKIEEEVYICQPLGFEDLEFPD
ncbi:ribonuclease H-like domain-containing protein [Tanacetum coccineum]|uniref:Ribonuclease H-like domain-containing protein n=1 Tax=Tanacetum coccineum TaxID=301880 RepID=A0ABQ5F4D8_9ASTR